MKRWLSWFLVALTMVLVACGQDGNIKVSDVWGRSSPMAAENGAFYMTIANQAESDDRLIGVRTEACNVVELHEMYMRDDNVMGMRPVTGGIIPVLAGETVQLEAGGLHVMCLGKLIPFDVGVDVPLTLVFEQAGEVSVTAEIRETAP